MSIIDLINSRNWISYNRDLARKLSVHGALVLSALCSYEKYKNNEEFYMTYDTIKYYTVLSEYEIKQALKILSKNNVVSIEKKGMPAKNYYKLNEQEITNILLNASELKINEQVGKNTNLDSASELKINEHYKIISISNNIIKHNNSNIDNNSYSEYTTIKDNDNIIRNNAIVNDTLEIETPTEGFNSKEEVKIGVEVLEKKQQKKPNKKIIKKGIGLIGEKEDITCDSEPALTEPTPQLFVTTKKSAKDTKNSSILIKLKSRIDKYNYNEDINKALYVWLDILKDNKKLISAAQLDLALEQINDLLKQKKTTAQIIQIIKDASVSAYTNFKWCIPKETTTKQINGNPYSSSKRTYDLERNHDPATMTEDDIAYWENRRISALPLEERKKEIAKTLIMDKKY